MRNIPILGGGLALAILAAVSGSAQTASDPESVVQAFYSTYRAIPPLGLPQPKQLAKLNPYFSVRLSRLLADAQRYQSVYTKQHPDDKPPFADGDLFSSNFEGFSTFVVGQARSEGAAFHVDVQLTYTDPARPSQVTKWQDAAIVIRERGRLVIDDFDFQGDWRFATRGRLSDILKQRD